MSTISTFNRFAKPVKILIADSNNSKKSINATLVELNKNDEKDLNTILKLSQEWDKQDKNNNVGNIYSQAISDYEGFTDIPTQQHFLALTSQKGSLEKLDAQQIHGILSVTDSDFERQINWLQVEPHNKYSSPVRKLYQIGSVLVEHIINSKKPTYVESAIEAVGFYKKLNFKQIDKESPYCLRYKV